MITSFTKIHLVILVVAISCLLERASLTDKHTFNNHTSYLGHLVMMTESLLGLVEGGGGTPMFSTLTPERAERHLSMLSPPSLVQQIRGRCVYEN